MKTIKFGYRRDFLMMGDFDRELLIWVKEVRRL